MLVGKDAIMATPAMSALIRRRKLYGQSQSVMALCTRGKGHMQCLLLNSPS